MTPYFGPWKFEHQPDIDICGECQEHAEFNEDGESECCGAKPYDTDYETEYDK